ncbi:11502_t:CDS:2, partial [Racocetra persica]
ETNPPSDCLEDEETKQKKLKEYVDEAAKKSSEHLELLLLEEEMLKKIEKHYKYNQYYARKITTYLTKNLLAFAVENKETLVTKEKEKLSVLIDSVPDFSQQLLYLLSNFTDITIGVQKRQQESWDCQQEEKEQIHNFLVIRRGKKPRKGSSVAERPAVNRLVVAVARKSVHQKKPQQKPGKTKNPQ